MSLINIENLTFAYPGSYDSVFDNVSFQLDTDWRLGLTGRNGRGKTTLLRLLMGQYEYSGTISSSVVFDYFPYPVENPLMKTAELLGSVCPEAQRWELERELTFMSVSPELLDRQYATLSNGEQTKVLLAALFLNEGHFLLIDEPTNHLDAEGRKLVSAYLRKKKGFILVSHDRDFLDGCVDHILSINRRSIEVQSGNFSTWYENFERRQNFELDRNSKLKKDIGRLQQSARRNSGWSDRIESTKYAATNSGSSVDRGYVGHQSAKMMKRAKSIETRRQRAVEEKSSLLKDVELSGSLKLFPLEYHSQRLAQFKDAAVIYDGRQICRPLSFEILRGDRLALEGPNGCGKSSVLRLLTSRDIKYGGAVQVASGLIVSRVPQDASHLSGLLSRYADENAIDESLFKSILRNLGFERAQFDKDMADFSGGQKNKVLIAKSLCEKAHLYVWDEPLNYLDVYSRMQIEELLLEFAPTMIFVEHDGAFRRNIATKTVTF